MLAIEPLARSAISMTSLLIWRCPKSVVRHPRHVVEYLHAIDNRQPLGATSDAQIFATRPVRIRGILRCGVYATDRVVAQEF